MKKTKFITLCLLFLLIGVSLYAMEVPIIIKDGDLDIPLEGVSVYISSQEYGVSDVNGRCILFVTEGLQYPLHITCMTPGYSDTSLELVSEKIYTAENPLIIVMRMNTVLEGDEIVVKGERTGKPDEKTGFSIVKTSEEIKTTAQIGIIEDVMNSISLLPGVGFKLGMNMEPSIRGGYPAEMGVTFDGVYLLEPFYWDGLFSILSPYMVNTVKLSTGIFSSKYGRGTSGLLDTTSVAIGDVKKLTLNISTVSADIAAELPLGTYNDLFLYAHFTELTAVKWFNYYLCDFLVRKLPPDIDLGIGPLVPLLLAAKHMPHIYTAYSKWNFKPVDVFSLKVNGLFAYDGIVFGQSFTDPNHVLDDLQNPGLHSLYPPYVNIYQLDTMNFQGLGSIAAQWLIHNSILINGLLSYNFFSKNTNNHLYYLTHLYDAQIVYDEEGNITYDENGRIVYNETNSYLHDDVETKIENEVQQIHIKLSSDFLLKDTSFLTGGIEAVLNTSLLDSYKKQTSSYTRSTPDGKIEGGQAASIYKESHIPGNNIFNSSVFILWEFGSDVSLLEGEVGIRGEHYSLWNNADEIQLTNYPVMNPRVNIIATPLRNKGILDALSFNAGSGLYSSLSKNIASIEKKFLIEKFTLIPDTVWTSSAGTNISFTNGVIVKLEGYYKHYLSRTYMYADKRDGEHITYYTCTDGKGYAAGSDVMIEKKINGWLDGYVTYSFLYARYYNPASPQYDSQTTIRGVPTTGAREQANGDPLGIWYYPEFHRFHTVNAVLNFRLPKETVITISGSFATGNPRKQYIDKSKEFFEGNYTNPGLNENLYLVLYSDTLRNLSDWPIDIRFSKKGTFENKKHTWEWYVGIENITGFFNELYKMDKMRQENAYYSNSGWQIGEGLLTIDMGFFPIPSIGVKMQF